MVQENIVRNSNSILRSLCQSILSGWKFLPLTVVIVLLSFGFLVFRQGISTPSLGDALGYLSLGMRSVPEFDPRYVFRIPLLWLGMYAYLFFSVGVLLRPKPSSHAHLSFFCLRRRTDYWLVTYLAAALHIIIHFFTILFVMLLCILLVGGEFTLQPTEEFSSRFLSNFNAETSSGTFFTYVFILPLLASIAIAVSEVSLIYFVGASQSFLCAVAFLVVSAFFASRLLLGNYLMLLRSEQLTPTSSDVAVGILIMLVCMFLAYCAGYLKIKKWDYI
jgi:hypothetical protein